MEDKKIIALYFDRNTDAIAQTTARYGSYCPLQLVLIRAQRHYSDSTFDAWVSGIDPKLDSIKTYQTTRIITIREPFTELKKTRWGFGVQAGTGAGKDGLTPYVGIGVSYNIFSW